MFASYQVQVIFYSFIL